MSHRHHNTPPPIPDTTTTMSASTNDNISGIGLELDPTEMDEILSVITDDPEIMYYIGQSMALARKSPVYNRLLQKVLGMSGDEDTKLTLMWGFAFLTGSSCAVKAVDAGYIEDTREFEDEDNENGN